MRTTKRISAMIILLTISLMILSLGSFMSLIVVAETDLATGIKYTISGDEVIITSFTAPTGFSGDLIIPSTLGGKSVTAIGDFAFTFCTSLTSIEIPDSVIIIGDNAFESCTSLASIKISEKITSIGYYTFYNCTSLISITIPDGVKSIGESAFDACRSLSSVTIPDSVTSIDICAFSGCISLTSIIIPDSVKSIGGDAFNSCISLTSITIPDGVTSIDSCVFQGCTGLTLIIIPDSVTSIGGNAFEKCISLSTITIPDSVTSIGDYVFQGCTGLTSITIPDGVTSIGNNALKDCTNLTDININDNIIANSIFSQLTGLTWNKVNFDLNGEIPDNSFNIVSIVKNGYFLDAQMLTSSGLVCVGWYTDNSTFQNYWDFAKNPITEDVTLYARWISQKNILTPILNSLPSTPVAMPEPITIEVIETPEDLPNANLISITAPDNAFGMSVGLSIKNDTTLKEKFEKELGGQSIFSPLSISIYVKGTTNKIQPQEGTSVEIICPIPTDMIGSENKIVVACLADGELQKLPTKLVIIDDVYCVKFTATHFSPYAFVVDVASTSTNKDTPIAPETTKNPKTRGGNTVATISLIAILSVATLTVVSKKRKFKVVKKVNTP